MTAINFIVNGLERLALSGCSLLGSTTPGWKAIEDSRVNVTSHDVTTAVASRRFPSGRGAFPQAAPRCEIAACVRDGSYKIPHAPCRAWPNWAAVFSTSTTSPRSGPPARGAARHRGLVGEVGGRWDPDRASRRTSSANAIASSKPLVPIYPWLLAAQSRLPEGEAAPVRTWSASCGAVSDRGLTRELSQSALQLFQSSLSGRGRFSSGHQALRA